MKREYEKPRLEKHEELQMVTVQAENHLGSGPADPK